VCEVLVEDFGAHVSATPTAEYTRVDLQFPSRPFGPKRTGGDRAVSVARAANAPKTLPWGPQGRNGLRELILSQRTKKGFPIKMITKVFFFPVPPAQDVVSGARVLDSRFAIHGTNSAHKKRGSKQYFNRITH
jgi:hypothetical protein